jgi:rubrerythrin
LRAVAQDNGWDEDLLISEVNRALEQIQVAQGYLLNIPNLCLSDPQGYFWRCPQCNRIHLHEAGGVCAECQHPLDNPLPLAELSIPDEENYYAFLASPERAGEPFRLHCEELTGQTNKTEALKRQRLFQDIAIRALGESPTMDSIDILSVTTTMEAGVDIGDLLAVMMANMPPQRFNYQQRVGRAGHRRGGLAGAITICGSRSHDNFYFQNPDRITGDPPPQPYLDLRRDDIIKRFLTAECLRQAFRSLGSLPDEDIGDLGANVHGQFGKVVDWEEHRDAIRDWLSGNRYEVSNVTEALLVEAPQEIIDRSDELIDWITNEENLLAEIDSAVQERGHAFDDLSELLANSGLLPMFGFPTKVRLLYHQKPDESYPWPPDGVVDRELEIAISQFAPGSETVKDKAIHTAIGLAHYEPRLNRPPARITPPYYDEREVGLCRACLALTVENLGEGVCPICGASDDYFQVMRTIEPRGFRTDFSDGAPYSGAFSYAPRSTHPRMPSTPDYGGWTPVDRVEISSVHGATICSINDNNGERFEFLPELYGRGLIVPEAIPPGSSVRVRHGDAQIFALASRKVTDVLLVRFTQEALPPGIELTPRRDPVSSRAAWYSFGFLLRKAAALMLDIDPNEINVGLRVLRGFTDTGATTQEGQLFISDSLDNGAGYANYLGTGGRFRELLGVARYGFWSGQDNRISLRHGEIESAELCDSSCYDCLRDYDNQRFHSLLDWRLALDMVRLALGETVGLSDVYWNSLMDSLANSFCDDFHWDAATFGGLPGGRKDFDTHSVALIISHPLWAHSGDSLPSELADAVAAAEGEGYSLDGGERRIEIRDVFELLRRPARIDAELQED